MIRLQAVEKKDRDLDEYFIDPKRKAYFIYGDDKLARFRNRRFYEGICFIVEVIRL